MAVTIQETTQAREVQGDRFYPIDRHGKLRIAYFDLPATTVAGDAGSSVNLVRLPQGRIRIFPLLSYISVSALGASRVMDLGHRAYLKEDGTAAGTAEAESSNPFVNDRDVSGATATNWGTLVKYDLFSRKGVTLYALVAGGTIPIGATMRGYVVYAVE